ncbi:hypothetical protein DIKCMJMK_03718 [Shewanella oneidensis]|nr:hypothetical protein [Shewanella oneidensis]
MTLYKREFGESFNLGFDHSEFLWFLFFHDKDTITT